MSFTRYLPTAGLALLCAFLASLIPAINVTNYVVLSQNGAEWTERSMILNGEGCGVYAEVTPKFRPKDVADDVLLAELDALRTRFVVDVKAAPFSRGPFDLRGPDELPKTDPFWMQVGRESGFFRLLVAGVDPHRGGGAGALRVRHDLGAADKYEVASVFRTRESDVVAIAMLEMGGRFQRLVLGFLALAAAVGAFVLRPRRTTSDSGAVSACGTDEAVFRTDTTP